MPSFNRNLTVWVLAPYVETNDVNLEYYYDFTQSIEEYTKAFAELRLSWKWQQVTSKTYRKIIDQIANQALEENVVVLNLCDGDEINKAPGLNVIRYLKKKALCFTGADEYFYRVTTSKIFMKEIFESKNILTPPWQIITHENKNKQSVFQTLGNPLILKPAISGGSLGVGIDSVVRNSDALEAQYEKLQNGYHGWQIANGGIIAEKFIEGPEFTTLIVGNSVNPGSCKVFPPAERVFNKSLPPTEKFLSFDRLWEMYEDESPVKEGEDFYNYAIPDNLLIEDISKISLAAYAAVKGKGYCRVDLRLEEASGKLYVLEVNSQCGLSDDENFTSIGAILRLSNTSFSSLIADIIEESMSRNYLRKRIEAKQLQLI